MPISSYCSKAAERQLFCVEHLLPVLKYVLYNSGGCNASLQRNEPGFRKRTSNKIHQIGNRTLD